MKAVGVFKERMQILGGENIWNSNLNTHYPSAPVDLRIICLVQSFWFPFIFLLFLLLGVLNNPPIPFLIGNNLKFTKSCKEKYREYLYYCS